LGKTDQAISPYLNSGFRCQDLIIEEFRNLGIEGFRYSEIEEFRD
jgi:hypothetical protein